MTVNRDAPPGKKEEIWSAPLADGSVAVMLFNKGKLAASISVTWEMLGLEQDSQYRVRDLWAHENKKLPATNEITMLVESHGVVMLKLSVW